MPQQRGCVTGVTRPNRRGPALPGLNKECAVLCLDLGLVRMTVDHRVDVVGEFDPQRPRGPEIDHKLEFD